MTVKSPPGLVPSGMVSRQRPRARTAVELERRADLVRALVHALQPEMAAVDIPVLAPEAVPVVRDDHDGGGGREAHDDVDP